MAKQRHLANPPIVEALVDIRARFPDDTKAEVFEDFGKLIADRYPAADKRMAHSVEWKIEQNQPRPPVQQSEIFGFMFKSRDGTEVVQSKPTGFSFSKLKPYRTWEAMLDEAWKLWALYRDTYRPTVVMRIATRFINRLEFPGPAIDLDDYLTIGPRLPPSVPQTITNFSTKLHLPVAPNTVGIVRCTDQVGAMTASAVAIMLDIDIIRDADIDPFDDQTIRATLGELRSIKNNVFFDSLTEKAVEVFA